MGVVYLAHDTLLDRLVAVKFIAPLDPRSPVRKRSLVEARAAARLQHPNVVSIYRVGEIDERSFIISEYVRGTSLDRVQRPMPWRQVLDIGIGLARGLAAAHGQGILHRDIKPANAILTEDGGVKILDFGLAKFLESSAPIIEGPSLQAMTVDTYEPARADDEKALDQLYSGSTQSGDRVRMASEPGMAVVSARQLAAMGFTRIAKNSGTTVWGTPLYMPPEIWQGKTATKRSDVYSLGVVLFELCAGKAPHADHPPADLKHAIVDDGAPPLASVAPNVDPDFAAVIDRCLHCDPDERFASADDLREALEGFMATTAVDQVPEGNPYRGLLAFEAQHRALFFGRSAEIRTLCQRLRSQSFVLVAGDSGVGKSSLCRAGVIPQILDGALGDGRRWSVIGFMPGVYPCSELGHALEPLFDESADGLIAALHGNPHAFVRKLQAQLGSDRGLLLFVDQLEELITVSNRHEEELFGELMSVFAEQYGNLRLLATARSDFLARLAAIPVLGDEIAQALYLLRPMSPENIHRAIMGPAQAKGVSFESDTLVDMLVESTTEAEGGLPLLQFALAELWDSRPSGTTTISTRALQDMGGVAGALARHADSVLLGLPRSQRKAARKILTALVTAEGTRTRRTKEELIAGSDDAVPAVDALVQGRLLVARETDEGAICELAHEALISGWKTLRGWLDEEVEGTVVKQRLEASSTEWDRLGRAQEALWSVRQVAEAHVIDRDELGARERAFLFASERRLTRKRYVRNAVLLGAPIVLIALYAFVQFNAARDLSRRVGLQVARGQAAHALATEKKHRLDELRREAFAAFDSRESEKGQTLWEQALLLSAETEQLLRRASQAFEAAIIVDGSRTDVRDVLGDILLERALLAEQNHNLSMRDELVERLVVYDHDNERTKWWNAPAKLTVRSKPSGAQVTLARYVDEPNGKLRQSDERVLGVTPIKVPHLAQGSYMLTLKAAERTEVRYPVVLGRGEDIAVDVPMPLESDIPDGFVYIPPGRFLFGSDDQEVVRWRFFHAVPRHHVSTDGYLIARNETTYADWLAYLRSLSPEERARQTGTAGQGAMGGAISLQEQANGTWRFSIKPTTETYTASSNRKLVYRTRKVRMRQAWLQFPVSGLAFASAVAYTEWLDKTGRVPGARLCTDFEWERAARGADGRIFPHGNTLEPDDANFDETYGRMPQTMGPDEVGSYPASRSPFGVEDMAGNVFEWVISSVARNEVVARGGSYFYDQTSGQTHNRTMVDASFQDPNLGLRVCASAPKN